MARVQELGLASWPEEYAPECVCRSGTVAECTNSDYTVSAPDEKGNCSQGAVARKKKRRARRITGRPWEAPPFPGTSGPPSNTLREPHGLTFDPTLLRGMTHAQLRNQLVPLIGFRDRMRRRFPSLADLWTRTANPAERQAADSIEQAEQLIRYIEKELLTRERISGTGSKSETDVVREAKADEAPTARSRTESLGSRGEPIFAASEDYRSVRYKGLTYTLTRHQSTIVRLLHHNHAAGHPDVDKDRLLSAIESETSQVRNFFRNSPLWKTLVVSNRKGTYRLSLPDAVPSRISS
jgi:hypothetical protein